ncbi:STAS/SEC14 domain-containing protein [Pseudonocardia sp. CA-107938]|uniref:STAS/SEC14 domain-containing protein n=1 Tax=Pseudonocardia sp. CA-107938 TaxID=3240021 RepID=UPI003D8B0C47
MIEKILDLPPGIDGLRSSGKLTLDDYDRVVVPLVADALRDGRPLRCLVEIPDFAGITPAAAFEDMSLGLQVVRAFEGCAVVTDLDRLADTTRVAAFLMPYPVRVFPSAQRAEAIAWLQSLPELARLTHRIRPDGVLVVEVAEPLRVQDVDDLARVVDAWLADHPAPHGLVLHAPALPGWENVAALRAHLRFVARHHRTIDRVALVVGGVLPAVAARVAGLILHPQVRRFGRNDLAAATAWAAGTR